MLPFRNNTKQYELDQLVNEREHQVICDSLHTCVNITQAHWAFCVHCTVKLQEDDYTKELGLNKILEPIIINLQGSKTEDDESDDHNKDNDSSGEGDDDNNVPLVAPLD